MMKAKLLLIEDDPGTGPALQNVLRSEGYSVRLETRGDDGLERARKEMFDLVLTDFKLPGLSGLDLIRTLHEISPKLPIIMLTAYGSTETAIEATKFGACEYLTKPCDTEDLLSLVESAVANSRLMSEVIEIGESRFNAGPAIVGKSRPMQALYKEIGRIAPVSVPVLIRGATGTGKELIARAIYQHSPRADKPFIAVNCAALPQSLIESELFGHERGAFTGANQRRIGRFEQADGGTLFLDEIGDLPAETQAKLLRVLQEKTIQRLGGDEDIPVSVRILAATHRDLETAIQEREFREDLYFRLNVVSIRVPPLAERIDDIPDIVRFFVSGYSKELGVETPSIQSAALSLLQSQPWPGNVRQLENAVRQALLIARPFPVNSEHVRQALARVSLQPAVSDRSHADYIAELVHQASRGAIKDAYWRMIEDLETELFTQVIRKAEGNQAKAARWLGITRLKMREKLRELGLVKNKPSNSESDNE